MSLKSPTRSLLLYRESFLANCLVAFVSQNSKEKLSDTALGTVNSNIVVALLKRPVGWW